MQSMPPARINTPRTYLNEVQGLRTIAALLVASYHIWFGRVSGGVDVFFVVAAFFMTKSLTKHDTLSGKAITSYYLSTLRRILPGLSLVVVVTVCLIFTTLPAHSWSSELRHAIASLLFLENWKLARDGADYLSQGMSASAFQQMWALSLQMQFYVAFPIIILFGAILGGTFRRTNGRQVLLVIFSCLLIASLLWSIVETSRNQPRAYFDTFARAWEFCAGALLALTIDRIRVSPRLARLSGTIALLVLLSFAAVINVSTQFPGIAAGIPVLAASTIIIAAQNGGRLPLLTLNPVVMAGDYSFSFYLWHWPLLISARALLGSQDVGLAIGLAIIAAAAALAWITTRLVETPFRRNPRLGSHPRLALIACVLILVPAGATIAAASAYYRSERRLALHTLAAAQEALPGYPVPAGTIIPDPIVVRDDVSPAYADGCHQTATEAKLIECQYGDKSGGYTIVLVGGSHSAQWLPALQSLARLRNLKIINMTKSACFFSMGEDADSTRDPSCSKWNEQAIKRILEISPDLVLTIATRPSKGGEVVPDGYVRAWQMLDRAGISVLALRDNPWFRADPVDCAARRSVEPGQCGVSRAQAYAAVNPAARLHLANIHFADFSDEYCSGQFCPVVRHGILRYRDRHHLTNTYVLALRDRLARAIDEVAGQSKTPRRTL